ncbi:N-acetyltransferase ECO1 [Spathaspora sp. JA1]|nr:N-acetyltransferase ECO1 [Spathaspora sp. JA1]
MTEVVKKKQAILVFNKPKYNTCSICEMSYNENIPSEQQYHHKYHNNFINGIPWVGTLPPLDTFTLILNKTNRTSKTIRVTIVSIDKSNKNQISKVEQLLDMVNQELNASQDSGQWKSHKYESSKAFVIIIENRAVGVCSTDMLSPGQGRWMIDKSQTIVEGQINNRVKIGISRIWICKKWRQFGLGMKLLQVVMNNSMYGIKLNKYQIGFSQPSSLGGKLAKSFNGVVHKSGEVLIPVYIDR